MTPEQFTNLISSISHRIHGKALDKGLEAELNESFPPESEAFRN